ncbi:hypothetical protein V7S50_12835, partial [Bacillus sp. CCNWLW194]
NKEVQGKEEKPVQPPQNNQDGNQKKNEGENKTVDGKTYTAPEVKQLAYSLGFFDGEQGLKFNQYGKQGDNSYIISNLYTPGNGEWDVTIFIYNGNKAIDEPLKALFNKMLPTKGNELYTVVNTPEVKSQELILDGRKIRIDKTKTLSIKFGPIEN